MGGLCAHSSCSSAAPSRSALVVGVLAVAGVIDDDPAAITQAAPPSPPASSTDRGARKGTQPAGTESISDIYKRVSLGRRVRPGRLGHLGRHGLRLRLRRARPHRHQRPRGRGGEPVQRPHRRRHQADPGPARRQGPVVGPRGPEGRPERGQGRAAAARARRLQRARAGRSGDRHRLAVRAGGHVTTGIVSSLGARSRRRTASRSPTRSRPTPRSTPATPAARCWTATAA